MWVLPEGSQAAPISLFGKHPAKVFQFTRYAKTAGLASSA